MKFQVWRLLPTDNLSTSTISAFQASSESPVVSPWSHLTSPADTSDLVWMLMPTPCQVWRPPLVIVGARAGNRTGLSLLPGLSSVNKYQTLRPSWEHGLCWTTPGTSFVQTCVSCVPSLYCFSYPLCLAVLPHVDKKKRFTTKLYY